MHEMIDPRVTIPLHESKLGFYSTHSGLDALLWKLNAEPPTTSAAATQQDTKQT
jgi:hypothetical protein